MYAELRNSMNLMKRLYDRRMEPVAQRHQVTRMELDILLFLANHPAYDTASDIIRVRKLTKSHVSASVDSLVHRQLLERSHRDGNQKLVHLKVLPSACPLVEEGREAQKAFFQTVLKGFSPQEVERMEVNFGRMARNIREALKEENTNAD